MSSLIQKVLSFLLHLGPLKGSKTILGAILNLVSLVLPAQYAPLLEIVSQILLAQGIISKAADASGVVPAKRKISFPAN